MYKSLDVNKKIPITLLLKGPSGSGKTTKAVQFPKPALFNFDNNLKGLSKLPKETIENLKIINPRAGIKDEELKSPAVFDNFVRQLSVVCADESVRTIIIDSASRVSEYLKDKILNSDSPSAQMSQPDWGTFGRYWTWLGEHLIKAGELDKNVIFIFHEQFIKDELSGAIDIRLMVEGKTSTSFNMFFSDVWRTTVKQGKDALEYAVRTTPGVNFEAKCSLAGVPKEFLWDKEKDIVLKQVF